MYTQLLCYSNGLYVGIYKQLYVCVIRMINVSAYNVLFEKVGIQMHLY